MNRFFKLLIALSVFSVPTRLLAQEYPYNDFVPELKTKKEYDAGDKLPVERPKQKSQALDTVFGVNLQIASTWTYLQDSVSNPGFINTTSGPGFVVALGFGWDMQNHPISIELETGFGQHLIGTEEQLSVVPMKFTTSYVSKISENTVVRIGLGNSLDLRTQNSRWSINPGWHLSAGFEYASFTIEPVFQIMRIASGDSYFSGALYFGYRI